MKKLTVFVIAAMLLLVLAGCGGASLPEANAKFCEDMAKLGQALTTLTNLGPTATVDQLKDAQKGVNQAMDAVKKSGANLKEAKVDLVDTAWKELDKAINNVSDDATLAQAAAGIKTGAAGVKVAYDQLNQVTCVKK